MFSPRLFRAAVGAVVIVLCALVMLLPPLVAGMFDHRPPNMTDAVTARLSEFMSQNNGHRSVEMVGLIDYWRDFHIVKAVLGALLLIAAAGLAAMYWRDVLRNRGPIRLAAGSVTVVSAAIAAFACIIVVANIQGAVAPLSSLMPFLHGDDTRIAGLFADAHRQLSMHPQHVSVPLQVLVDDFARYHGAFAVVSALLTFALLGAVYRAWRSIRSSSDRRVRRWLSAWGAAATVAVIVCAIVCVANIGSALNSPHAMLLFVG